MQINRQIPIVALRGMTILPGMVIHFDLSRSKSIKAVENAMANDQEIFVSCQKNMEEKDPGLDGLHAIGCICRVKQIVKLPKGLFRVLVEGTDRAELLSLTSSDPFLTGEVAIIDDNSINDLRPEEQVAIGRIFKELLGDFAAVNPKVNRDIAAKLIEINDLPVLVDQISAILPIPYEKQQQLLDATSCIDRVDVLMDIITKELLVSKYSREIQEKVKERLDKNQREYYLREQVKLIREELGDDNFMSDADAFEEAVRRLNASDEVKEKIQKEIKRFKNLGNNYNAETGVVRTYIETMLEMPWDNMSEDSEDLEKAARILDEDHYGLTDVKERILEFLAVRIMTSKAQSPILCLVGPPGTGKSSIARSVARALDKKYVRIALGGIRDEAEIRGHRKTYVGAMPGRISAGLKMAGTKNPVMLLDEIDKISTDYKGDTFSALLEVLDSEQHDRFRDHYLEVPVDLSQVLFIATANSTDTIPRPLLDRMELIEVGSYTENEKLHIATEHLIPRQLERHGLDKNRVKFSPKGIEDIIRYYTKEAGVRQLERKIGEVCRKSARKLLEQGGDKISVNRRTLEEFLGRHKFRYQMANSRDEVGIVRGLAWTSVGGDTLQIEVNVMDGKGDLTLTGHLGDVMKESAQAGISYIRSVADKYDIDEGFFKEHDIHVHIPEGAVPKDGPSAGITMATAMLSAVTGRKVRADVAMTGEITLRGRVLPIGGLKEKLLAARNAGIKTVIVPIENKGDVEEISSEITGSLDIVYAETMDQVLRTAFAS